MEEIKAQFDEVIRHHFGIENPKTDKIFEQWAKNKEYFIKMFGDKLIYEYGEVSFHVSTETRKSKVMDFAEQVAFTYHNEPLAQFILANSDYFYENRAVNTIEGYEEIPVGMKLLKAFKFFENDIELLKILQDKASMIIQEDKICGTLCFSVHPLDFLSSSENNYKWRSCHALDGEYAAGNISYMCDAATIICYIKGREEACLPNFPPSIKWNDKKWRMLLHLAEGKDMLFAGRQYPFSTDNIFRYVKEVFSSIIDGYWSGWDNYIVDDYDLSSKYIKIDRKLIPIDQIVHDNCALHYNDLLYSSVYKPYYTYDWTKVGRREYDSFGKEKERYYPKVNIGYEFECLDCGESFIDAGEGMVTCNHCDGYDNGYSSCDCCGRRVHEDDMIYMGDSWVCPHCFENETFLCGHCGTYHWNSDAIYYEFDNKYYCEHCYAEIVENDRKRGI